MSKRILLTGTGALASLFAARLAAAGAQVLMLGSWPEGLRALNEHGVRLQQEDGSLTSYPVEAFSDPSACGTADAAIVLVKAWQTHRAAGQLQACLAPHGVALTLQNGLGNREVLAAALGADRTALGVTTTGATLVEPGVVRAGGEGTVTVERRPQLVSLVDLLRGAGFHVEESDSPESLVWSKLVINAAINPPTALLGVPNGRLLEMPPARELMARLARETASVAAATGLPLTFPDPVEAAENVARRTAANHSSMFQDLQRGAPTEIDAISGAIAREGQRLGVPAPVNETMWQLVRAAVEVERSARV